MSNPSQLLLLADHIKLSLLERQRAQSLNLERNPAQDSNISRSLESFRESLAALESKSPDEEALPDLRAQYNDLFREFHGESSTTAEATLSQPNDLALREDFAHAQTRTSIDSSKRNTNTKNVRFRDNPSQDSLDSAEEANRAALFQERYRDEELPDPTTDMSNQQVHEYHQQIMQDQDDQLDRLGESIGRQRYLGMQISDELEGQIALLDEVDRGVDRHQSRLDGAKKKLNRVGEKAKANWGMTTIIVLITKQRDKHVRLRARKRECEAVNKVRKGSG
ncbi:hypothetical protein LTS08_002798 [Lithohypha guttulata]|uniref:t-SNARE coiled-coil homology domain-containing protein n=1 Tax=Lithohypha guttulata TaxID=1690604 RepID=A0AAN7T1F3_9EURO|nr:hypothetical protein LTR51_000546 [Lithohypha guttulata]KAK5085734.1 hypothetical protein LTR05_005022 [Lithohypha guttulata]KAK5103383.1 hypothetical protein LTS08_002798 [Lithohypha guttulata]